ncbi:hypothetical protein HHI36_003443, partial [Cryptolaemus montrouzieri]
MESEHKANNGNIKNQNGGWKQVGHKRQTDIGQNKDTCGIKTIPCVVSLHVTRLHHDTKAEDLERALQRHLP